MNSVVLIGRLVRDPNVTYTSDGMAVAKMTLAVDRDGKKDANGNKQTDFPQVVCYGKQAEVCETFLKKGRQVAIQGRIQTGSYQNKDGKTVYTTDVIASRVEFLYDAKSERKPEQPKQERFEEIDDDVPF